MKWTKRGLGLLSAYLSGCIRIRFECGRLSQRLACYLWGSSRESSLQLIQGDGVSIHRGMWDLLSLGNRIASGVPPSRETFEKLRGDYPLDAVASRVVKLEMKVVASIHQACAV
jgi:hypothetical protein